MYLYHTTLEPPTAINAAVVGNFSGGKSLDLCVARGSFLEMKRLDVKAGRLNTVCLHQTFSVIRALETVRLPGTQHDYLVVGTDSGVLSILGFEQNQFRRIYAEIFGKSGCRRVVPGEYVAVDPRGRAVLTAALERQKFVYSLSRSPESELIISSPLEHSHANLICETITGVDVGFDNPIFAALEVDYEQSGKKLLVYYELDLGLNTFARKWSTRVSDSASYLVPLPGGSNGPSGVLVCCQYYITYVNDNGISLRVPIPRRLDPAFLNKPLANDDAEIEDMKIGFHIVAHAIHKMKTLCFLLLQTEQGDLFRIDVVQNESSVSKLTIQYYDTIPVANVIQIFKAGFLFVASDSGNHSLYQIQSLGGEEDSEQLIYDSDDFEQGPIDAVSDAVVYFQVRELSNLAPIDELVNIAPVVSVNAPGEDTLVPSMPHDVKSGLYVLSGRGHRSACRFIRWGRGYSELAATELPGNPTGVWALHESDSDVFHKYIVVTFINATLVLEVQDSVEEASDTGFLTETQTIAVHQMRDGFVAQIHAQGFALINLARRQSSSELLAKVVVSSASNSAELLLLLADGTLAHYELDSSSGKLFKSAPAVALPAGLQIRTLYLPPLPRSRKRAQFAVALCAGDATVRSISLNRSSYLETISIKAQSSTVECVHFQQENLWLGTVDGLLISVALDLNSGNFGSTNSRYLGLHPVEAIVAGRSREDMLILSQTPWVFMDGHLLPIDTEPFSAATGFRTEQCPFHGFVGVSGMTLRIFTLEKHLNLMCVLNESALGYTPRRLAFQPHLKHGYLALAALSEVCTLDPVARNARVKKVQLEMANDSQFGQAVEALDPLVFGNPFDNEATATMIKVLDCATLSTLKDVYLNLSGFVVCDFIKCPLTLESEDREVECLVVALRPRTGGSGSLQVYHVLEANYRLAHSTSLGAVGDSTPTVPFTLRPLSFGGNSHRLLVGTTNKLRLYSLGKKQLLRKTEFGPFPSPVTSIEVISAQRIVIGTLRDSLFLLGLDEQSSKFSLLVDDALPRWIVSTKVLDGRTVAAGDKFGNVFVLRAPSEALLGSTSKSASSTTVMPEAAFQWNTVAHFYVGDTVVKLMKSILIPGGDYVLFYVGVMGSIGCFLPMQRQSDIELGQQLQNFIGDHADGVSDSDPNVAVGPGLFLRSFRKFRGYYQPSVGVVDGDLCQLFNSLEKSLQDDFAETVDVPAPSVWRRLQALRQRFVL